jgi:hypothetical protein
VKLAAPLDARIIDSPETEERRLPRRLVNFAAHIADDASVRHGQVIDVSEGGCRIRGGQAGELGTALLIKLPGLEPLRATVVWGGDGEFGCSFDAALHPATIELLVRNAVPRLRNVEPGTRKRLFHPVRTAH